MSRAVELKLPADQFALHSTLESLPRVEFELARVVARGPDLSMPLVWARGVDLSPLRETLADDESVRRAALAADFDGEYLFSVDWRPRPRYRSAHLVEADARVLDARASDDTWRIRVLFPSRESVAATREFCDERGIDVRTSEVDRRVPSRS